MNPGSTYSEQELVALLQQREARAFSYLYDHYAGALLGVICGVIRDRETANDVLQNVFVNIWRKIESYDASKGRLFTWMLNIARNAAIDEVRSKGYREAQKNKPITDPAELPGAVATLSVDDVGLKKVLSKLKEEWKLLIDLSYFQGFTHEEIARMLSLPLGTVKTRIRSALIHLRTMIRYNTLNIQEYISSGIVESYVLGLASVEERREFEQLCTTYPELRKARTEFELALEKQAMANAVTPGASVKEGILQEIGLPARVLPASLAPVRKMNGWKYAAAAAIALLAGSIYLNITLSGRNARLKDDYREAVAGLNEAKKDIHTLIGNPEIKMASMKGTDMAPAAYTTVYWDTASHDVYLLVNNLPKPADSLQYQLWALADGQPFDLGFISDEHFVKQDKLLLKAKNAQKAQAFAITLEKKGRADITKPEGQMYVLGNL